MPEYTVKRYAEVQGVEERTVRRWIAKGAVEVRRTPGGGIRIVDERSELLILQPEEEPIEDSGMTNDDIR